MKVILLLIIVLFSSLAISGCTNDEGEGDLDILIPEDEQEQLSTPSQKED